MSVLVTSWVWHRSPVAHRGDLLVLLVLADHAHDDGSGAYPSVDTIADKARLTRRGAQLALRRLEERGAIRPTGANGPHGTVEYRVLMADPGEVTSLRSDFAREVHDTEGRSETHEGAKGSSPEPSRTVKEPSSVSSAVADETPRPDVAKLCHVLADLIRDRDPKAKIAPDGVRWRDAARKLVDLDGRTPEEVERVIRWSQADHFWHKNVMSMESLRRQFDRLWAEMHAAGPKTPGPIAPPAEFAKYDRRPARELVA